MLARASHAPLDINIDLGGASRQEVLLMFPPHLSHTRKIRLYSLSMLYSENVRDIYSREAPALEHFELGVSDTSIIIFRDLGGKTLFKGQAPRLRTLFLSQVLIPWSLIPRGQLTRLTIGFFREVSIYDVPSHRNLYQMIDLLVHCPELEMLVLGCCLPPQLTEIQYGQTIHLPRLSRLCLAGSSSRVTNLMKMLILPSSTNLHFHCLSENTPTHNDRLLLPFISAQFQGPAPIEFKNLSVTINLMDGSLEVTASTSAPTSRIPPSQDFESDMDDDDDEFVLSFDGLPKLGNWTGLLERVCKILPISNLEFFSISAPKIVHSLNLVEIFKRCTEVTTIQAVGRGTGSLVRALTTPKLTNTRFDGKGKQKRQDDRDGSTPAQPARSTAIHEDAPIFPKLAFLSLKRLDFAENERRSGTGILFDVGEKGLRQRRVAYEAPLKVLYIDNCAISAKRAEVLQKLVQTFHWDGKEVSLDEFWYTDDYDSDSDETGAVGSFRRCHLGEWGWWEDYLDG